MKARRVNSSQLEGPGSLASSGKPCRRCRASWSNPQQISLEITCEAPTPATAVLADAVFPGPGRATDGVVPGGASAGCAVCGGLRSNVQVLSRLLPGPCLHFPRQRPRSHQLWQAAWLARLCPQARFSPNLLRPDVSCSVFQEGDPPHSSGGPGGAFCFHRLQC